LYISIKLVCIHILKRLRGKINGHTN
jgi:hypothetical protein